MLMSGPSRKIPGLGEKKIKKPTINAEAKMKFITTPPRFAKTKLAPLSLKNSLYNFFYMKYGREGANPFIKSIYILPIFSKKKTNSKMFKIGYGSSK